MFFGTGFGIDFFYGVKFDVGVKIMEMKGIVQVEPYGGLMVWGELGIGAALYGKLRLEGFIMDIGFPTKAEVTFNKFPLDVRQVYDIVFQFISKYAVFSSP